MSSARLLMLSVALCVAAGCASSAASDGRSPRPGALSLPARIAPLDRNGDGLLQKDEMPPAWRDRFEAADTDKSGALDGDEVRALLRSSGAGRRGGAAATTAQGSGARSPLDAAAARAFADTNGYAIIIMRNGAPFYQRESGAIHADTIVAMASATKWYHAALIMSLVDEGKLSLDAPIGAVLTEAPKSAAAITLRQLLSHTSGIDPKLVVRERYVPDAAQTKAMLSNPLLHAPGAEFHYGGADLQIAAVMAERVTAKDWNTLFAERIASKLQLSSTRFGADPSQGGAGSIELGSGVRSTANDYAKFLAMLVNDGVAPSGVRVLSAAAVREMQTDQTAMSKRVGIPPLPGADAYHYGLGEWCETVDAGGRCPILNSTGAFGTMPFIDKTRGLYGIVVLQERLPRVWGGLQSFRRALETSVDAR